MCRKPVRAAPRHTVVLNRWAAPAARAESEAAEPRRRLLAMSGSQPLRHQPQPHAVRRRRVEVTARSVILYAAVEIAAEVARHRMVIDGGAGWLACVAPAAGTLLWAYAAHQRLAFRSAVPETAIAGGALRYGVISLAVLDGCAVIHRLVASMTVPAWIILEVVKFVLLSICVWRPSRLPLPAGDSPFRPKSIDT